MEIEEHLFRRESGRLTSILTRLFGVQNLPLVEDVVQEAFVRALETWKFHGVPDNPSAWLMATAKRCAIDALRRQDTARRFAPEVARLLESEWTLAPTVEEAFDAGGITDSQLRMMFSCVHPSLPPETQVALILQYLCGFGMDETAAAFLKQPGAMQKRLVRAKRTLAGAAETFDLAGAADVERRLPAVQRALYLLFNEGYHGASAESSVREELCTEARRLTALLLENRLTATPDTYALAALLDLDSARLRSRRDMAGDLILLADQDRSVWDRGLIASGRRHLERAAASRRVSTYHLEAAIAELHCAAAAFQETDWGGIVYLYDALMAIAPSPVIALNRAVAIGMRDGAEQGLAALQGIADRRRLSRYPFYFAAVGECEARLGHVAEARDAYGKARRLARSPAEQRLFDTRLSRIS